jgi:hypothetical protein
MGRAEIGAQLGGLISDLWAGLVPHWGQEHCGHCPEEHGDRGHWLPKSTSQTHYNEVVAYYRVGREKRRAAAEAAARQQPNQPATAPKNSGSAPRPVKPSTTTKTRRKGTGMSDNTNGNRGAGQAASSRAVGSSSGVGKIIAVMDALHAAQIHEPIDLRDELAFGQELAQLPPAMGDCLRGFAANRVEKRIPTQIADKLLSAAQVVSSAGEHVLDYGRSLWTRFGPHAEEMARRDTPGVDYYQSFSA